MRSSAKFLVVWFLGLLIGTANAETAKPEAAPAAKKNTVQVVFQTTLGEVHLELFENKAPVTVKNFLQYVDSGFYNGVIFHRVVPGFVAQGGGFDRSYQQKPTLAPIINESDNGERNSRGTIAMARTTDVNSATAQFFINLRDNFQLDASPSQLGYAVFGRVVKGMDVVDSMAEQPQGKHSGVFVNAPNEPIVIDRAYRLVPEKN